MKPLDFLRRGHDTIIHAYRKRFQYFIWNDSFWSFWESMFSNELCLSKANFQNQEARTQHSGRPSQQLFFPYWSWENWQEADYTYWKLLHRGSKYSWKLVPSIRWEHKVGLRRSKFDEPTGSVGAKLTIEYDYVNARGVRVEGMYGRAVGNVCPQEQFRFW